MKRFSIIIAILFSAWLVIAMATNKPYQEPRRTVTCGYFTGIDPITLAVTPAKMTCIPGHHERSPILNPRRPSPENFSK